MKTIKIYEVGDRVGFTSFAFENKAGGTGSSDSDYNEKYVGAGAGVITKAWEDDECGWRFWIRPTSKELVDYIERNSNKQIVYVSEFDIMV